MIAESHGQTRFLVRDGSALFPENQVQLEESPAASYPGFVREKLETLAYQTTFDPGKRTGRLPINTSLIRKNDFKKAISAMKDAFEARICVSDLVAVAPEGEQLGSIIIPAGFIGLATVGSVAINGVLLQAGLPYEDRFGGVLQIKNAVPRRFVALIEYSCTSVDPSEQFLRARMTRVREAVKNGNGRILGVFRTIPALAKELFEEKIALLRDAGIRGIFALGNASEPVCQIPVSLNRIGVVQLSGLNPMAAAAEAGFEIENIAESGLIEFQQLCGFQHLFIQSR